MALSGTLDSAMCAESILHTAYTPIPWTSTISGVFPPILSLGILPFSGFQIMCAFALGPDIMEHPCELLLGLFGVRGGLKIYAPPDWSIT